MWLVSSSAPIQRNKEASMESGYMKKARQAVVDYLNARVDKTDGKTFNYDETFVV